MPLYPSSKSFAGQLGSGGAAGLNPADATTYYLGVFAGFAPTTTDAGAAGIIVPVNATLRAVYGRVIISGTLGSNDGATSQTTVTVRKNASSDIATVTSTLQLTANPTDFNNTSFSVAVSAGDVVYLKFLTGTWTTNPTGSFYIATLYFDVP